MRALRCFALLAACLALAGCAAVRVSPESDLRALAAGRSYTLSVHTDSRDLDPVVYKMAFEALSPLVPLGGDAPVAGHVQITFSVKTRMTSSWTSAGFGSAMQPSSASQVASGTSLQGPRTYENGAMSVVVTGPAGEQLWSAQCDHKGKYSLATTAPEVAKVCLDQIASTLKRDMKRAGLASPPRSTP